MELVWPCGDHSARNFSLRTYNAQRSRRVWGHAPLNLDHMIVLVMPSETTIIAQNVWQLDCNSGDTLYGRFSEPLSLWNQPLYMRHCYRTVRQNCRFECFMFAGHEAVIHIEMCAVSE